MSARAVVALCLLLGVPLAAEANFMEGKLPLVILQLHEYRDAHGHVGMEITFPDTRPDRNPLQLTQEDVRAILKAFEKVDGKPQPLAPAKFPTGNLVAGLDLQHYSMAPPAWEVRIHKDSIELYGEKRPGSVPVPENMEESRFFQALRLSVKYMPDGAREQALELFTSPAFVASMAAAMTLYMIALAAPEPFLSKGFVTAATLYLGSTYGMTEVINVAKACRQLYVEAEAARNMEELERAAESFGKQIAAVGLRILVTVAIGRLAGKLPEVPNAPGWGGLWTRLGPPRYAVARGVTLEGASIFKATASGTAVVVGETVLAETAVANGTILLMGALLGAEASAAKQAIHKARTTGGCRPNNDEGDAPGHHIATNKNGTAEVRGGPWTPAFENLFMLTEIGLEHPANKIFVIGHKGPHPEAYHQEVYNRLQDALRYCVTPRECTAKLIRALDELAEEICEPDSTLNKFVTRKP